MKTKNKIQIKVNGKSHYIGRKQTMHDLVKKLKIPIKKVAIELNKKIINKNRIKKISLKNKDMIEIVHFIGGG